MTYAQKAELIQQEIAELEAEDPKVTGTHPAARLARLASLRRSLKWYLARSGRQVEVLGVEVGDEIVSTSAVG